MSNNGDITEATPCISVNNDLEAGNNETVVPISSSNGKSSSDPKHVDQTDVTKFTFFDYNSKAISELVKKKDSEKFWESEAGRRIINYYCVTYNVDMRNLFSILMYDWKEQSKMSPEKYFLNVKLGYYDERAAKYRINVKLIHKLLKFFDVDGMKNFHHICLKILHFYFNEINREFIEKELKIKFDPSDIDDLVNAALEIKNEDYKIQILKLLVVFIEFTDIAKYQEIKEIIKDLSSLGIEGYKSIFKIPYRTLIRDCDKDFFDLAFNLIENHLVKFKNKYKKFVTKHQNYFGEYWTYSIKPYGRLLCLMSIYHKLTDTKEFLLIHTKGSNIKYEITDDFKDVEEFRCVLEDSITKDEKKAMNNIRAAIETNITTGKDSIYVNLKNLKSVLKNTPYTRRLFFGRETFDVKSIFEEIFLNPILKLTVNDTKKFLDYEKYAEFLGYIWSEFRLWEKPEIFQLENPLGEKLIDYVLQMKNDYHIMSFFMIKVPENYKHVQKPLHCMMLKDALCYNDDDINRDYSKCMIEYHLDLINKDYKLDDDNCNNLMYLLEEVHQYCPDRLGKNEYFQELLEKTLRKEPEVYDRKNELKRPTEHFYIGLFMIYWGYYVEYSESKHIAYPEEFSKNGTSKYSSSQVYNLQLEHKSIETNLKFNMDTKFNPFLHLLSLIIQEKENEFLNDFPEYLEELETSYKEIYNLPSDYDRSHQHVDNENIFNYYEKYSTHFCFILAYAAIKTNQKAILEKIFEYINFLTLCPEFPPNMIPTQIHNDAVSLFLDNKYELGRQNLPKSWISETVLKDFLDSRISCQDDVYKIDCKFMLPYYNHEDKPNTKDDDPTMMNEDHETMEYIINDHNLESLVTHPVMEMIIMTKIQKYDRIFFWNLIGFFMFYILPTIGLVYIFHSNGDSSTNSTESVETTTVSQFDGGFNGTMDSMDTTQQFDFIWIYVFSAVRFLFLVPREIMQYFYIYGHDYFKKTSNWVEILLVIIQTIHIVIFIVYQQFPLELLYFFLIFFEGLNVFFMIIASLSLYPSLKFSIYMKCFQTAFSSYMRVFFLFVPLFLGCASLAFILFDKSIGGQIEEFHSFGNASMKYIMMYSGELDISSDKITGVIQGAVLTLIIILIINKTNLILSIAVNDISNIMEDAKIFSLKLFAKKYVEFAKKMRNFYAVKITNPRPNNKQPNAMDRIIFKFIKLFICKYPHLHQIRTLLVEKKSGQVYIDERRPIFESTAFIPNWARKSANPFLKFIIKRWDSAFSHLVLDSETMNSIKKIMEKRDEEAKKSELMAQVVMDSEAMDGTKKAVETSSKRVKHLKNLSTLLGDLNGQNLIKRKVQRHRPSRATKKIDNLPLFKSYTL